MATNFLKRAFDPMGLAVTNDMGKVFITSGSGVIGNRVVTALLESGHKKDDVRVGVWKGERALEVDESVGQYVADLLERKGATVITFDWTDPEMYGMALADIKTVFFTLPCHMKGATVDKFAAFVNACKKAGVEHFVTTSNDQPGNNSPYNQLLRECNEVLKKPFVDSRMSTTILHTAHLMSTPLILMGPILRKEKLYITASYSMGVNYVSPNDVAHAVVAVLATWKKHKGKSYRITGAWPPVKDKDVADLLTKFYDGKNITHMAIGYHDYEDELKKREYPDSIIADAVECEKVKASGIEEKKSSYTGDLESLIGGGDKAKADAPPKFKAETFEEYLANKGTMTLQENPRDVEV